MSRQQRLTLIATILGSTVVFLDSTVVNVALPAIGRGLHVGLAGQQWVVEAYMLSLVSLLLVGGSLGDQFGRQRMFTIGLIAFGATSILCAIAPSAGLLIGARALQGVAGALLVPGSLAIVAASFEGESRGRAVGTWTAWTGIATVVGPAGGGALIGLLSWRAIFWVNIPLIAVTVALTLHSVKESRDPDAFRGIDWLGIALSAAGLGGPVFALIEQPTHGWGDPLVWAPLVAGIVCFALFVLHEARARHPMLDLALFKIRNFAVANLTTLAAYAGLIGGLFFVGLFLQQIAGYSPLEAGLATTPVSIVLFVLSPRFGKLASGVGPRLPMTAGPIVGGLGLLLLLRVGANASYVTDVLPAILVFGLGLSATVAPLTATVLDSVEERHVGVASGANNGIARVAGLLAIAILGAVISAHFGTALDSELGSRPLSPAAQADVSEAKEQPLGRPKTGDLAVAEAARLGSAADGASTSAFHLGIGIAGILMIVGGVISGFGIEDPRRRIEAVPAGAAAAAGECGHGPDADRAAGEPVVAPGSDAPEPEPA
ncbi:MAG TPA: DHA2 family efflux MFS transporter permease subunit [Solirubrobacterales bacterium]|nr:DHA2 family efflux MFS transporter permease subunit [Solirubrobacterales bacterium]